jgi:flagella basal body P-ring formation protein FlgA
MTVLRASSIVPHRQLVSKIKEALADAGVPGQIAVDLSGKIKRLHVPRGHKADVAVDDIRFDNNSGRFSALVHAPAKDRNARQIEIKGRAHAVMDVPVLVNRVPIGQKITKQDIGWIKQRLDRTGRNAVTDAGALIGMAPKRPIRTNKPVRSSDLQRPVVVGKGGTVSIVVSTPGMTLAMMGKALENGGIGDSISVMNPQTRKIIQGEVIGRGQVKVQVHRKFLAALN